MQHNTKVEADLADTLRRTISSPWPGEFRTLAGLAALKAGFRLFQTGSPAAYPMLAYAEKMLSPADEHERQHFDQLALRLGLLLMDPQAAGRSDLRELVTAMSDDMLGSTFLEGTAMDTIGGPRSGTPH